MDIALRVDDLSSLDEVIARLERLPAADATGSLQYARGKALFAKGNYDGARAALAGVAATSDYNHQTQYLLGVILMKQALPLPAPPADAAAAPAAPPATASATPDASGAGKARFAAAIEQFRRVTRLTAQTSAQRHVSDLAWMAVGRLFYESDNFLDAAEAYSHVDRTSPEFTTMLYEIAWVYVRMGDYQRAQRALEVLSIMDPEGLRLADGSLLRADLLLRSGEFDKALTLYRSVRAALRPDPGLGGALHRHHRGPRVLLRPPHGSAGKPGEVGRAVADRDPVGSRGSREHPSLRRDRRRGPLARPGEELPAAGHEAERRAGRAGAGQGVQGDPERPRARAGLLNRIELARRTLAQGMDDVADDVGGELGRVRAERRALMKRMGYLPANDGDFARRDAEGEKQWTKLSQQLQTLTVQVDKLQAITNGLKRVMRDASSFGVTRDPMSLQRFQQEIDANERELRAHENLIRDCATRWTWDARRSAWAINVTWRTTRCAASSASSSRAKLRWWPPAATTATPSTTPATWRRFWPAWIPFRRSWNGPRKAWSATRSSRPRKPGARSSKSRATSSVLRFKLDELDQQARLLVGEVAMQNFALVRDKLKSIVLRADVGIVQHAWEVREEQRTRVNALQRERAREEQNLNDELREVIEDAEDDQ